VKSDISCNRRVMVMMFSNDRWWCPRSTTFRMNWKGDILVRVSKQERISSCTDDDTGDDMVSVANTPSPICTIPGLDSTATLGNAGTSVKGNNLGTLTIASYALSNLSSRRDFDCRWKGLDSSLTSV
jgi:hypothetical protein